MSGSDDVVLEVENLHTTFDIGGHGVPIVKGVSFSVRRGRTLAIVGESGCGKSVTVHSVVRLLPRMGRITGGRTVFKTESRSWNLAELEPFGKEMRAIRGRRIGMIFQDPMASLNPVHRVGDQVAENLLEHFPMKKAEARERIAAMFASLGIPDPKRRLDDFPHQFSGGMKQRVMIAIAMVCDPDLLIADEPTTALDVTIQAQIMELMENLKSERGKSIVLITHNMGLVAEGADDVAVMYMGRVVEYGSVRQIFEDPAHPYTKALLRSVPVLGRAGGTRLATIRGSTPNPADCGPGCEFSNRCDFSGPACGSPEIGLRVAPGGQLARCTLYSEKGREP